ncbi:hypothetical protein TSAR_002107 [Trichomalopsis sarcophagae]|uniref:JmjC domain-containing protein n=1 Tax=Trichomalopsis sarcophagae TaxID=543379 RepID=A0A232EFQ0_9HYME|nr:hypothetical protein TSAR_002107 [Trichomalopsis sarcophagae]
MVDFNPDFVRFREMADLDDAMRLMQAPTAVESDPSVYVFRNVRRRNCYRNMCAEFAKICLAGQPAFSEQRLLCTQEPDFFQNPKMRDEAALVGSPEDLFKRMGVPFRTGAPDLCSLAGTRAFFDQCVRDVASGRHSRSVEITYRLCELPWHHHPARNPDALAAFGVNEPSVYVSGRSFYDLTVTLGDSIGRLRVLGRNISVAEAFRDVRRRNCYRNMCAEFAKICLAGQPAFSEQRLLYTQELDFFLNLKKRDEAALVGSPEDLFKRMGVPFRTGAPDLCSLAGTRAFFDQCVRDAASGRLSPVYWQNTTSALVGITSRLCELPWHHYPARNPEALAAFGVNEPSVYVSGRYALTDIHVEDNYLDSANVIRFGEVGSGKVWLLVHPRSFYDLTVALGDSIGRLRVLGRDDVSDYLEGCPTPANHKNICITSEYLQARNIPHQFITQRPGDLVYVGPGIYHQVINLGISVAEAVNVPFRTGAPDLCSLAGTRAFFDQCVRDVASGRHSRSVEITYRLCELPWHHHPARNPDALAAFGVNEPSVYVSGRSFYDLTVTLGDSIGRLRVLGRNISVAEAVNVGAPRWNAGADRFVTCRCPSNAVGYVPFNPTVTSVVRDRFFRRHVCPTDGCPFTTYLLPHMWAHAQVEYDPDGSSKHHACSLCPKIYKQKCHLMRHHRIAHAPGGTPKKACRWCGDLKSASNMSKHERICSKS